MILFSYAEREEHSAGTLLQKQDTLVIHGGWRHCGPVRVEQGVLVLVGPVVTPSDKRNKEETGESQHGALQVFSHVIMECWDYLSRQSRIQMVQWLLFYLHIAMCQGGQISGTLLDYPRLYDRLTLLESAIRLEWHPPEDYKDLFFVPHLSASLTKSLSLAMNEESLQAWADDEDLFCDAISFGVIENHRKKRLYQVNKKWLFRMPTVFQTRNRCFMKQGMVKLPLNTNSALA